MRKQVEETKTNAINTLLPLKEYVEKLKAVEEKSKKGEQIYG